MLTQVTLTLPDYILQQAQHEAHRVHKSLDAVLADALGQIYPALAVHPQRTQMQQEVAAFHALHPQLCLTHSGEFVAFRGGQLVDHALDFDTLLDRVRDRFGNDVIVMIDQVLPTLMPEIRLRSPRLLKEG